VDAHQAQSNHRDESFREHLLNKASDAMHSNSCHEKNPEPPLVPRRADRAQFSQYSYPSARNCKLHKSARPTHLAHAEYTSKCRPKYTSEKNFPQADTQYMAAANHALISPPDRLLPFPKKTQEVKLLFCRTFSKFGILSHVNIIRYNASR